MKQHLPRVEMVLRILALIGAGLFFLWRLFTGWLIANVSLSVAGTREAADNRSDFLAVAVAIEKGSTDAIWLQHASVRVRVGGQVVATLPLEGFQHLSESGGQLDWRTPRPRPKGWAISPGETLWLATHLCVPADRPAVIEAAIFGRRTFWPRGFQWRATSVSLPIGRDTVSSEKRSRASKRVKTPATSGPCEQAVPSA